ncbi:3-keto-5-aminohexanoate cleavage protein [Actinoallomurus iriomotensis]|uniref:3-keto-5-aminohexanoate cleavage protein n=1 Tax=Actinoallomurus iriomotensis TaxID=478107 RepID=A0A9W6RPG8_9ACTN|nr:3-keto-5-aminohexanoate cleavage protein [Actinoallomurus iriomotensis]GLY78975.1 3-keto-5-aminohexanoate cleavage protein [Actinoallomurus iriomotensis]
MKPLIIGVNVNEGTGRDPNPHVPFTPKEIAEVARDCERAGASLMHYHGRTADGRADHSAPTYADIARETHRASSLLLAPSMANVPGYDVEQRLSNIAPNQGDPETAADLLPVDMGCANMDLFDADAGDYASEDRVFVNDIRTQRAFLERAPRLGLRPYLASFNLSWTRAIVAHERTGRLARPLIVAFVLGGEEFVAAHPTTASGVRAHLEVLPAGLRIEWLVSSHRGDVLEVADDIIAAGGHLVVGIGDHPYTDLGHPATADLVARVAELGRRHGRRPATTDEARRILGVPTHASR